MTDPSRGPDPDPGTSAVDRVADVLRRELFAGERAPGTPLREVALADALGASRPTIRHALAVLVAEGLADRVPHRGTVVRSLDAGAIEDISRARLVMEGAGVRAWPEATQAQRDALRRALEEFRALPPDASAAATTARHLAIHRSIVALAGSERVLASADLLYAELRLALATVDRERRDHAEQVRSHCDLVELIGSGDTATALAGLADHLDNARRSLLSTV